MHQRTVYPLLVGGLAATWVVVGFPSLALAHVGVGPTSGLLNGLAHPVTGLDHILAMVAVGLWAAQRGGRAIWLVPLAFVMVMAVGGALGMLAISIPFVEQGIVASVLVLGVLIAAAARLPLLGDVDIYLVNFIELNPSAATGLRQFASSNDFIDSYDPSTGNTTRVGPDNIQGCPEPAALLLLISGSLGLIPICRRGTRTC